MELKTPMVFVKHIIAAQRGDAQSIQYLCERTSGQFVKICRKYDLSNSQIEAVLAKAYGLIFADIKSVRNPQTFMSWAGGIVEDCCAEIAGPRAAAPEPKAEAAVSKAPEPAAEAAVTPPASVPLTETAAAVSAPAAAAETATAVSAPVVVSAPAAAEETVTAETAARPTAFYDENAYVQPSGTYNAEVNYADEASAEEKPAENRIIPVDEIVYRPDLDTVGSSESSAPSDMQSSVTAGAAQETEQESAVPDPSVYASIPTFASSYEEEAVFQDVYPAADKTASAESKVSSDTMETVGPAETAAVSAEDKTELQEATAPVKKEAAEREENISEAPSKTDVTADEPDVDLIERDETGHERDDANIGVNGSDYDEDDEDDDDDEELQSGLAFRTKVLIGLLCVFIFGACVGIGYAISKGMTAQNTSSSEPGVVETQADTIEDTQPESLVDSLIESVIESLGESSVTESGSSNATSETTSTGTTEPAANTGGQTSESPAADPAGSRNTESQAADSAVGTGGEVTARADIATYLGGTFASVFRDYPDIPRSVYRGELSLADSHIGFIGSYDATQPVSSTIVESVSLLGEGGNFNINGFYIGMTAADAESLAAAGGYISLEMTAESSREYLDEQDNTLSLTIDGGVVKSVTLRSSTSDNVSMENADEVVEEVPEEIPGEAGGVG